MPARAWFSVAANRAQPCTIVAAKQHGGHFEHKLGVRKLSYVRSWPGKENPTIKKYPYLAQHNLIDVCDTIKAADGSTWYYVRIVNKYYGFVAARYITRV